MEGNQKMWSISRFHFIFLQKVSFITERAGFTELLLEKHENQMYKIFCEIKLQNKFFWGKDDFTKFLQTVKI